MLPPNAPHGFLNCPARFNLAGHVLAAAARVPDKIALRIVGERDAEDWTYGRLAAAVGSVAAGLRTVTQPGDKVLLRFGNTAAFPLAYLGAAWAGVIPVVTSAQLTGPEITSIAHGLRPTLVLADEGIALPNVAVPVVGRQAMLAWLALPPAPMAATGADDPAYVLYTSGSSGVPRGVLHAHRAIWARGMMREGWQGLGPDDRLMHAGAFNWSYTLGVGLLDVWAAGGTAVVPATGTPVETLPRLMRDHGVTIFAAVPGIYRRLLRLDDLAVETLRHGLSAGETLPQTTRQAWRRATSTDLHEALGMTECSTFISSSPQRPAPEGSCGYVQTGRQVAILDEAGKAVPQGELGVLAIHRDEPGLFLGYLDGDTATGPGDWFLTGDSAVMDAAGAIRYLGRTDDMMNAGGNRVSPLEVEMALNTHADVTESAAVEIALRSDTSVIAAAFVGTATPEALRAHAENCLAPYKRPRHYQRVETLPRSQNGKINRRALREEWTKKL